jgi:hypothetical protein
MEREGWSAHNSQASRKSLIVIFLLLSFPFFLYFFFRLKYFETFLPQTRTLGLCVLVFLDGRKKLLTILESEIK